MASSVIQKKDRSPVTVADFGSQALVCRQIRQAFPDDPIIAEEDATLLRQVDGQSLRQQVVQHVQQVHPGTTSSHILDWVDMGCARSYSNRFWTLDPIDGTKGFLRGQHYAVALALIIEGQVSVAALACPHLRHHPTSAGAIFAAIRGQGAMSLSLDPAGKTRLIRVSPVTQTAQARFCESVESAHTAHNLTAAIAEKLCITLDPIRVDSQTKYAIVASGEADIYLRLPTRADYEEKIWDHAAGALIMEEAGGTVTDITGTPLDFTQGTVLRNNKGIVATNGSLHQAVIDAIASTVY